MVVRACSLRPSLLVGFNQPCDTLAASVRIITTDDVVVFFSLDALPYRYEYIHTCGSFVLHTSWWRGGSVDVKCMCVDSYRHTIIHVCVVLGMLVFFSRTNRPSMPNYRYSYGI